MGRNDPKQQKRRAQKEVRRKAKLRKRAASVSWSADALAKCRIDECRYHESMFSEGIGDVLVSRRLPNGQIAFALFLVDPYCLGIKNVAYSILARAEYRERRAHLHRNVRLVPMEACCAKKLIEGAVQWAADLGFRPHADYGRAAAILAGIDAGACDEEFKYGKDGKPLFINGPNESPARCDEIVNTLRERCGPGQFDFIIGGPVDE